MKQHFSKLPTEAKARLLFLVIGLVLILSGSLLLGIAFEVNLIISSLVTFPCAAMGVVFIIIGVRLCYISVDTGAA